MGSGYLSLLKIESANPEVQRRGRLLQILMGSLTLLGLGQSIVAPAVPADLPIQLSIQTVTSLLVILICLRLIHNGRLRPAIHTFFFFQTITQFIYLVSGAPSAAFAYLMLVNLVAIAILDSVTLSLLYSLPVILGVILYAARSEDVGNTFLLEYALNGLALGFTTWLTAYFLRRTTQEAVELSHSLQQQTKLLESRNEVIRRRAGQLRTSAEIGQIAGASLDPDQLMWETAVLIQEQFDFYYVALYLLDGNEEYLVLREAAGAPAAQLKAKHFRLALEIDSIICWAARNREARIAIDVRQDPHYLQEPLLSNTQSEIALPLLTRGEAIGVLDMQSEKTRSFQDEDVAILQILANQIATSIDNSRLFAQTQRRLNETETLLTFNNLLSTTLDIGEIYRRTVRTLTEQIDALSCAIYSWNAENHILTIEICLRREPGESVAEARQYLERKQLDLDQNTDMQRVLHTLETLQYHREDPNLPPDVEKEMATHPYQIWLAVPLVRGAEAVGMLTLFRGAEQPAFQPTEVRLIQAMATQTAVALDNATLASQTQAQVAQLSTINRVSSLLSVSSSLKEVFEGARREIMSLIEATGMSIVLVSAEQEGMLEWIYGYEYGQEVNLSQIPPLPMSEGFSGYVVRNREVLHINKDITTLHEQLRSKTVGAFPSSWLGLPLIVANKLIGVLSVENELDDDAFDQRDIDLLTIISGPLAIAINNLRQFEAIQEALAAQSEQRVQLQTAAEVAAAATSIRDLDELLDRSVTLIKERFDLYYVGLFLIDRETDYAVLRAGTGEAGQIQIRRRHRLKVGGQSLVGGATGDGQPRISQDVSADSEWRPNPLLPETRSELALPLQVRSRIIGALTVQSIEPSRFAPEMISILQTLADQLAVAIDNAQLLARAEARARREQRLNVISAQMHRTVDVDEIIKTGLQALSEQLQGAPVGLRLRHGRFSSAESESERTDAHE